MSEESMLDPLSYTESEANAMIGKTLVETKLNSHNRLVDGYRGVVVGAKKRTTDFNQHEFCLEVKWTDREGNSSEVETLTREQIEMLARPLNVREKLVETALRWQAKLEAGKSTITRRIKNTDQELGL